MHEFAAAVNVYRELFISFLYFSPSENALSKWRSGNLILWAHCLTSETFRWEESLGQLMLVFWPGRLWCGLCKGTWALPFTKPPDAAGISASSSLEMYTEHTLYTWKQMVPDVHRGSGHMGKMYSPWREHRQTHGLTVCTRRPLGNTGVLCLWYLNATSQINYIQTTHKSFTKIQTHRSHLMENLILLARDRACESAF